MSKQPKNEKTLRYELERLENDKSDHNGYNELIVRNWSKKYKQSGDKYSSERCERSANNISQKSKTKK
ncbi:hypothetical protein BLOT_011360 [Blomia tropicalis]|nr:hypothetical protein BLOT_011360 [Blomia tropicalis]